MLQMASKVLIATKSQHHSKWDPNGLEMGSKWNPNGIQMESKRNPNVLIATKSYLVTVNQKKSEFKSR